MIKFLHAADLHLDSPFASLSPAQAAIRRKEQLELLQSLTDAANAHACDLVLLAGDLFDADNAYPETVTALSRALAGLRAEVFLAPGNHDYLAPGSAYLTHDWPENVHIFTSQQISCFALPEKNCRVWGAGFVRAQVEDEAGRPIPGFTFADCTPVVTDSTKAQLRFRGGDLSALRGRVVRLRFEMIAADLYAFWVAQDEQGHSGGYVAAGGPAYPGPRDI